MEYHKTMKRNILQIYIITMINIKCILRTKRNLFQQAECYMIPFLFFQKNFIKVQLIYNVVFISDIWQNASAHQRQGGRRGQPEPERGNLSPREASSIKLQAGSHLLTKTCWDTGRLTSAGTVAARDQLPRRDTQHT